MNCGQCGKKCFVTTERSFVADASNNDVDLLLDASQTPNVLSASLHLDPNCSNKLKNSGDGWCVECQNVVEITDGDLAIAGSPTAADVTASGLIPGDSEGFIYYIGTGTAQDPDFVWFQACDESVIKVQNPGGTPNLVTGCGLVLSGTNLDLQLLTLPLSIARGTWNLSRSLPTGTGTTTSAYVELYSYTNNECGPIEYSVMMRSQSAFEVGTGNPSYRHYVQTRANLSWSAVTPSTYDGQQGRQGTFAGWDRSYGGHDYDLIIPVGGTVTFEARHVTILFAGTLAAAPNALAQVSGFYHKAHLLGN